MVSRGWGAGRWGLLIGTGIFLDDENVLELHRGDREHNIVNVLNVTELNPLKWVVIGYLVNVISTKRRQKENVEGRFWPSGCSLQPPV